MSNLIITRKKMFRSALVPYLIIVSSVSKKEFMQEHNLQGDLCKLDDQGRPIGRIDINILERVGIAITNGETQEINITDTDRYIFVSTIDGSLSNEIKLNDIKMNKLLITTKGGITTASYPFIQEK